MTLSNTNTRMDYIGNGAVSIYSYTFKIFANSHLQVTQKDTSDVETLLVLDTDYTVTGAGDTTGGSITLLGGNLPSLFTLSILRVVPLTQGTDFRNQGDSFRDAQENEFDLLVMADQQLQEVSDRTLTLPVSSSGIANELPAPVALKWWRYNSGATALELIDGGDLTAVTTVGADLALSGGNLSIANPNRLVLAGGTVDVITGTSSPSATSLTNGLIVLLEATGANATTTPTFNLDALGAKTIVKGANEALEAGDIAGANYRAHLMFDASLDKWVMLNPHTGIATLVSKTLTSPLLTTAQIVSNGAINSTASRTYLQFTDVASAVNYINATNAITGEAPILQPSGSDTNADLIVRGKGTGGVKLGAMAGSAWPSFSVHKNGTNQSPGIATGVATDVTFSTEEFDTNSDFASNVFTPTVAGKYLLTGAVVFTSHVDTGIVEVWIYKNASPYKKTLNGSPSTNAVGGEISVVVDANGSTDAFKLVALQSSASTLVIDGTSTHTYFTGCRIG